MVLKCIVCGSSNPVYSFHRFPKNNEKRRVWLSLCNLEETSYRNWWRICSKHFREIDFDTSFWPKRVLLSSAVPAPSKKTVLMEIDTNTSISSSGHIDPAASTSTSVPVFGECPGVSPGISSTIGVSCSTVPMVIAPTEEVTESTDISKLCPEKGIQTDVVPTTPSQNIRYVGDLEPLHFASPRKAKRHLEFVKEVVQEQKKKIRKLHDQEKALKQHIHSLQNLLDHLMEKNILSEHAAASIKDETPSTIQNILRRQLQSKNRKYLPGLRAFALTLHFYSSNAYNYVRRQFNNLLPHPETIRQWYAVLDGRPGFTKEAFEAIRVKQESDKVIINLVIDEISIRQQIQWQGGQYHGYVEFGNDILGDSDLPQEARNALVFMAVALNSHWKITLGYFLINTLNSKERANLLTTCLDLLSETGASCHSVTYDGAPVNISMCTALGANYNRDNFKPWFLHKNTAEKVHTIWDACHMIKLARSALGDKKIIYNSKGEAIEWKYIEMLHELEKKEGLKAATKLSPRHINYHNEKMKVKLAVQTLSASVSSALLYCKSLNISEFQNCEATAEFCMNINNIFDILNTRNLFSASPYRKPLSADTYSMLKEKILYYIEYLTNINDNSGIFIIQTNRKTGFLGLIVSLTSYLNLYQDLIETNYLKFLLSYKLSQDHLETYFSALRSRGGHNNNPTALQFKTAYKRFLVRHQISASKFANCSILDSTTILFVGAGAKSRTVDSLVDNLESDDIIEHDHDYFSFLLTLSPFIEEIVKYISGFVVRKVKNIIKCRFCLDQLESVQSSSTLLTIKKYGNLTGE